ncbi:hypothetical protein F4782DRAFT_533463 [Xylaria castorea]|nr:hypothetical protein F4782DRAFT_533463 [Xylaria castorea]
MSNSRKENNAPSGSDSLKEVVTTRKGILASFGVGVGVSSIVATGGVSALFTAYKLRSTWVTSKKLEIIQAELQKRNVKLHKFRKPKDFFEPIAAGDVSLGVGNEVSGLIDGGTNIEQMGAGLLDNASPSTGLLDDPGEAVRGAEGAEAQYPVSARTAISQPIRGAFTTVALAKTSPGLTITIFVTPGIAVDLSANGLASTFYSSTLYQPTI